MVQERHNACEESLPGLYLGKESKENNYLIFIEEERTEHTEFWPTHGRFYVCMVGRGEQADGACFVRGVRAYGLCCFCCASECLLLVGVPSV